MDNATIEELINKQIEVNEDLIKVLALLNEEINTITFKLKTIEERMAQ